MIDDENIFNPYAFEIKKQCILNVAFMVLKITNDDMEDNRYIEKEYHIVEKNEELKDIAESIIDKVVKDVIHEKNNTQVNNTEIGNTEVSNNTFWSSIIFF